jgi:NAD(P)-dependent dehydrogenase (short-subunit alcohol dehydrogenase family)
MSSSSASIRCPPCDGPLRCPVPPPPGAAAAWTRRVSILSRHITDTSAARPTDRPQTVLITGVTSGLGRALAVEFARRGHRVVGCGRRTDRLDALRAELSGSPGSSGSEHVLVRCDVSDKDDVRSFRDHVVGERGIVPDVIWANSGVAAPAGNLWEVKEAHFDRLVRININGVFYVLRAFLPDVLAASRRRGATFKRVLATSSGLGHSTSPILGAYSASKWAVEALLKSCAQALAAEGNIGAYPLAPGVIQTEMMTNKKMPTATQWSKDAVAYVLHGLTKEDSGRSVTVPGYYSDEYKATWVLPDGMPLPSKVVAPFGPK